MLFNSFTFLVFFVVVFVIYWFALKDKIQKQNSFLLLASYVFYGWWDWRFLGLIIFSTLLDYFIGNQLRKQQSVKYRKIFLGISILFNLGLLCYFKYVNFFIENWISAWASFGFESNVTSLNIILPVGISFYTFQTLSYTIDVYRRKIKPTTSLLNFATFVAFFPQLVDGPIERASHLLPQFSIKRKFDYKYAMSGVYLIAWGLFKKIVIADTCATYVTTIFDNYQTMNTLSLLLGAVYFAFQIYGDFSGYSDIAIGISRILGFDLKQNFNKPYFSRNIAEFWRRWHISLSTWFRDYLYIPLGGSMVSPILKVRNVFIIFLVSGFWHGANWTFIFWGFLNAIYFLPLLLLNRNRTYLDTVSITVSKRGVLTLLNIITTFFLVTLAWVFFRANTITEAFLYLRRLFTNLDFSLQYLTIERYNIEAIGLLILFIIVEWCSRNFEHPFIGRFSHLFLFVVILLLITMGVYSEHANFIYFQF